MEFLVWEREGLFCTGAEVGCSGRVNVNFSQGESCRYLLICQGCQIWGGGEESQSRLLGEEGASGAPG